LTERKLIGGPARRLLRGCFTVLSETISAPDQLPDGNQAIIQELGILLVKLADPDAYPYLIRSTDLWLWCYRIAKHLEGKLMPNYLRDLYDHYEAEEGLPTKSLSILSNAHEVLGKARKCWKKEVIKFFV
jgi:hypothetical protein